MFWIKNIKSTFIPRLKMLTNNLTAALIRVLKTGEMEVKNPMFHDDPTPATPAQSNNKEEDHI